MGDDFLRVVLDTNVLLVSISSKSKYHWIFKELLEHGYELFITNEILTEYEEIISQKYSPKVAKNVIRTFLLMPNIYKVDIYYNWNLIIKDTDDNKFVDCAIAANAHVLVTQDRHFDVLEKIVFPKVSVMSVEEFKEILKKHMS